MAMMNAAVVTSFDEPPHYQAVRGAAAERRRGDPRRRARRRPAPAGAHRSGRDPLHQHRQAADDPGHRRASGAARRHADLLRRRRRRGRARWPRRRWRTGAGRSSCPTTSTSRRSPPAMNPAMSSWVALRRRVPHRARASSVLVLGATGNAGTMAVQVARRLGAGRVVRRGRDRERLRSARGAGADVTVRLGDDLEADRARARRGGARTSTS